MLRNLDSRRQSPDPDGGIEVASQVEGRSYRPVAWLIILIFITGLGAAFILERYNFLDQTVLPVSKITEQSTSVVSAEGSPNQSILPAQIEAMSADSVAGTAETSLNSTDLQDDATWLPVEQSQQSIGQSGPETDSPLNVTVAQISDRTPGPSTSPRSPVGNRGAASILQQPSGYYAVQLIALRDQRKMLNYARDYGLKSPLYAQIRTRGYISNVLLLGVYPDRLAAVHARNEFLGAWNLPVKPWIRKLGPLQDAIASASKEPDAAIASGDNQTDMDQQIQQLLRKAEFALMRERLTSPAEDNAFSRYSRILEMVPDHPAALAGIDEIVGIYLELAGDYVDSNNFERAARLIDRAERVGGPSPEIAAMQDQLAAQAPALQETAAVPEDTVVVAADLDSMETTVRHEPAASGTEQGVLKEVEGLLLRDAETEARYRLEQFLVTHPDSIATIETLFRLYLRIDDPDMAQRLLDSSSHLPFLKSIELAAQLKVQQGNLIDAVKMLESATPNYEEASYYALLAGLYQQLGRYREAASHYRHLLNEEPEQGTYWLGLAVSLDSLRQNEDALVAFKRTRDTGQYDGDVKQYVEQRISVLSR